MKKGFRIHHAVGLLLTLIPLSVVAQMEKLIPQRMTPAEIPWSKSVSNQAGSAMRPGLETVTLAGDGKQSSLYSLVFKVPPNTAIPPHSHPDDRSCFVLSGLWYFGYGSVRSEAGLKALPPGSNYTEPAGVNHFAGTKQQEAIVECTAVGPTATAFVNPADDPRNKK
ncbi:MAG TPA: cupin domain-containing protein [Candidatus Acidoferrales bacterium]|nr:cupin domain-containing protein [Candidatus Acidoferrales bacterium]